MRSSTAHSDPSFLPAIRPGPLFAAWVLAMTVCACRSAYYSAWEKLGVEKREILVERVEKGRDAQAEAKEQFVSAMEAFQSVTGFQGGDLEKLYSRLAGEHEDCAERVEEVGQRIESIEKVAGDLFDEWKKELAEYGDASLRARSQKALEKTRDRYEEMIDAMKRAESKMHPVLSALKDRVLYLKHNLNAQAIASLSGDLASIERDVSSLVAEMERSIAEANDFISAMRPES